MYHYIQTLYVGEVWTVLSPVVTSLSTLSIENGCLEHRLRKVYFVLKPWSHHDWLNGALSKLSASVGPVGQSSVSTGFSAVSVSYFRTLQWDLFCLFCICFMLMHFGTTLGILQLANPLRMQSLLCASARWCIVQRVPSACQLSQSETTEERQKRDRQKYPAWWLPAWSSLLLFLWH